MLKPRFNIPTSYIAAITMGSEFMCGPCSSPEHTDSQLPNRRDNTPSLLHMDIWTSCGCLCQSQWVSEADPPNWSNQGQSRNTATNKHTVASEEPQAVPVQLQVQFPVQN